MFYAIFCKHPLIAKMWRQSLKNMNFANFSSFYKGILNNKLESESDIFLCMAVYLNVRLPITSAMGVSPAIINILVLCSSEQPSKLTLALTWNTKSIWFQARVESFPPEVQLGPSESESPRWACPLPAEECLLLKERGAGGEGPQGAGAAVRGGQVQHAHIPLPLRDLRLHHAGWNPGLSHRDQLNWIEDVHIVQARLEIGPYDMAVHTPAFFRQNLVSWHSIDWQWALSSLILSQMIISIKEYS